jgi:hypothetical protein
MATLRKVLAGAGWKPGRAVDTSRWEETLVADGFPPLHAAAREFLGEFGGLRFPPAGPGVTRARESVTFDPTDCLGEWDRFVEWGAEIGRDIAPIGELAGDNHAWACLGIDERAEIYLVREWLATFGRMPEAMKHLLLGYMPETLG